MPYKLRTVITSIEQEYAKFAHPETLTLAIPPHILKNSPPKTAKIVVLMHKDLATGEETAGGAVVLKAIKAAHEYMDKKGIKSVGEVLYCDVTESIAAQYAKKAHTSPAIELKTETDTNIAEVENEASKPAKRTRKQRADKEQ